MAEAGARGAAQVTGMRMRGGAVNQLIEAAGRCESGVGEVGIDAAVASYPEERSRRIHLLGDASMNWLLALSLRSITQARLSSPSVKPSERIWAVMSLMEMGAWLVKKINRMSWIAVLGWVFGRTCCNSALNLLA